MSTDGDDRLPVRTLRKEVATPEPESCTVPETSLQYELRGHQTELEMTNEALRDARHKLEESRDRYIDLFEFAPVGYLTLTGQGAIAEINLTATKLLGISRRFLLRRQLADFVVRGDRDCWQRCLVALTRLTHRQECELRLLRGDGDSFYARLNGIGVPLAGGEVGVRITLTDISEHKQLEAANERELRLRLALQAIAGGLYDWDRHTNALYWSTELAHIFGVAVEEFRPDRSWWRSRVHPDDVPQMRRLVVRALRSRASHMQTEYRICDQHGLWMHVSDRAHIVRGAGGRIARLIGTITDITARKTAQTALLQLNEKLEQKVAERTAEAEARAQALAESEHFARATIDALSSRLCVVDENGQVVATNRAWRAFEASLPDGVKDRRKCGVCNAVGCLMPFWSDETVAQVEDGMRKLLSGRCEQFVFEYEFSPDTSRHWFEMRAIRFSGSGPVRLVITHDEISERKLAAEVQHKSADRLKQLGVHLESLREQQSMMIARELHDELGAALTMIKLGLATIAQEMDGSERLRKRFDALVEQVNAALQVVKRVSSTLRPPTLDTLGLIATISSHVAQFSRSTGIATSLLLPDYVRLSAVGSITVFRIIQEGLTNVAKHSGANRVTIHVRKYKQTLIVRLKDNGSGFAPRDLMAKDAFGIMGMRERAEHLGGQLSIDHTPSQGTVVTLCIPLDS